VTLVHGVLCYDRPRFVHELVRALHWPDHAILLHADAKADPVMHKCVADLAAALPNVHVVDSLLCSWGGWSLVEATLRLIGRALALPTRWRHFCLLSEHHLPLHTPAMLAKSLCEGMSFSDAVPLPAMDADHRRDLFHRFVRRWRELPGVGMFSIGACALSPAEAQRLRLGSQWVVLAREACERLWRVRDDDALWAPFRESLVPDETALMSVLRGTALGAELDFRKSCATFVAWPHLGGGTDSGFTDDIVRAARARGYMFIRKRPVRLQPFVAGLLGGFPDRPMLPGLTPGVAAPDDPRSRALAMTLADALRRPAPGVAIGTPLPGSGPACCLDFRVAGLAPSLSVHLLSHDFAIFKLLLAWRRPFDGALAPIQLGGFETTIMGARLPGLVLAREVHVPAVPDNGFLQSNADALARHLTTALAVARALSDLVPLQAA
jgi:hypothetical protein